MLDDRSTTGKSLGLFLLGCFLFSYPVLTIFNLTRRVMGIPLFFLYIFGAWMALILMVLFSTKHSAPIDPYLPDLSAPEKDQRKSSGAGQSPETD